MAVLNVATSRTTKRRVGTVMAASVLLAGLLSTVPAAAASAATAPTWRAGQAPRYTAVRDRRPVELGVRIAASRTIRVYGVRFWKAPTNTGRHRVRLWDSKGRVLATAWVARESRAGWQTARFTKPVLVRPGTTVTASYLATRGSYSYTPQYFSVRRVRSWVVAITGTYRYGGGAPQQTWRRSSYGVEPLWTVVPRRPGRPLAPKAKPKPPVAASRLPVAPSRPPVTPSPPVATPSPPPVTPSTPVATGWPGPSNTGVPAGTQLRPYSGTYTITTPNITVSGLDISGCVVVAAPNVTLKNSRVRGSCTNVVYAGSSGLVIEDVEIDGLGNPAAQGIGWGDYTARRVNIHGVGDGARANGGVLIEQSWIHDLATGNGSHNDGIQITEGSGIVIRGNTIENANMQTSAILIGAHQGSVSNVTVQGNLLAGGGYALYGGAEPRNGYTIENIKLIGNQFSTKYFARGGYYGAMTATDDSRITSSGNVWQGSIAPVL